MRNRETESAELSSYNDVVDYINQWNDTYYKAANDIEQLISKYYKSGTLRELKKFYSLLDAMKERSECHAGIINSLGNKLKHSVQELL